MTLTFTPPTPAHKPAALGSLTTLKGAAPVAANSDQLHLAIAELTKKDGPSYRNLGIDEPAPLTAAPVAEAPHKPAPIPAHGAEAAGEHASTTHHEQGGHEAHGHGEGHGGAHEHSVGQKVLAAATTEVLAGGSTEILLASLTQPEIAIPAAAIALTVATAVALFEGLPFSEAAAEGAAEVVKISIGKLAGPVLELLAEAVANGNMFGIVTTAATAIPDLATFGATKIFRDGVTAFIEDPSKSFAVAANAATAAFERVERDFSSEALHDLGASVLSAATNMGDTVVRFANDNLSSGGAGAAMDFGSRHVGDTVAEIPVLAGEAAEAVTTESARHLAEGVVDKVAEKATEAKEFARSAGEKTMELAQGVTDFATTAWGRLVGNEQTEEAAKPTPSQTIASTVSPTHPDYGSIKDASATTSAAERPLTRVSLASQGTLTYG